MIYVSLWCNISTVHWLCHLQFVFAVNEYKDECGMQNTKECIW